MSDLVVIKVKDGININPNMMKNWQKKVIVQKETGVIVLPWFLTVVVVPENTEIQFEKEDEE